MTNREIAQEISNRIGTAPVPFDSVYSIALEIYHQLGGEEAQFDSVYSILLEILPLVEGGSGKAIEEVDALPEASENKDKLFRLSSDKKVYVSELVGTSTEEVNAPESEQIDNAILYCPELGYNCMYKGPKTVRLLDGNMDLYFWYDSQLGYYEVTLLKASEIEINGNISNIIQGDNVDDLLLYNDEGDYWYSSDVTINDIENMNLIGEDYDWFSNIVKQTVTTETWAWEKVATEQYVDDAIAEIPQLEAGQNIEIADNNISANGYIYNETNKTFHNVAKMTSTSLINKYSENGNIINGCNESTIIGSRNVINGSKTMQNVFGRGNTINNTSGASTVVAGIDNTATNSNTSAAFGVKCEINGINQFAAGYSVSVTNDKECGLGKNNVSHTGDSDLSKTTLSIGDSYYLNSQTFRNLIEVMQNGDIYLRGVGGYDGIHIKSETGYENTKTLQEYIASLEARNIVITGSATLLSDANMTVTGITNVVFDGYTETDLAQLDTADVKMNFEVTNNGSTLNIETVGRLSNQIVTYQGQTMSAMILISFNWTEMSSFKLTTLHIGYMEGLGWIANEK